MYIIYNLEKHITYLMNRTFCPEPKNKTKISYANRPHRVIFTTIIFHYCVKEKLSIYT